MRAGVRSLGITISIALAGIGFSCTDSVADDTSSESRTIAFAAGDVAAALDPAEGRITAKEQAAVDAYLAQPDAADLGLDEADLEVGTLNSDQGIAAVVVTEESSGAPSRLDIISDGDDFSVGAGQQLLTPLSTAAHAGPGMGSWPNWADAFHASVRIDVFGNGGSTYLGNGIFQTYRREMQNDASSRVDFWQVARRARGNPATIQGPFGAIPVRVEKLWASQHLRPRAASHAREWMLFDTKPVAGFSNCQDDLALNVGPFTFAPKNCEDYDVWMGDIGHQRMYMDQGRWIGTGSRALAYVSGFSMAEGRFPVINVYEFITLTLSSGDGDGGKCPSTEIGRRDDTLELTCVF